MNSQNKIKDAFLQNYTHGILLYYLDFLKNLPIVKIMIAGRMKYIKFAIIHV